MQPQEVCGSSFRGSGGFLFEGSVEFRRWLRVQSQSSTFRCVTVPECTAAIADERFSNSGLALGYVRMVWGF